MSLSARLEARDLEHRRGRELLIWRFRLGTAAFATVQSLVDPGDSAALGWSIVVAFSASVVLSKVVIERSRSEQALGRLGLAVMGFDWLIASAVLANDLHEPASPVYLVAVLALLESTMRWPIRGGLIGGLASGGLAACWTVLVHQRIGQTVEPSYATMRFGVLVLLGIFFGALTRRLSEQHDTLERILDTSQDLIVTVGGDGTVLAANAACADVLGWRPEEVVGRQWRDFLDPDQPRDVLDAPLTGPDGDPTEATLTLRRFRRADGRAIWLELSVSADPASDRRYAAGRDVTERLEADRLLKASEQRFRSLFDHNPDAVYSLDVHGRITSANPASQRLVGWSLEELQAMPSFQVVVAPDHAERTVAAFERVVAGEPQNFENVVIARDGRRIEVEVTAVPIVVDDEVVGVFGVSQDITERRRLERELAHRASHDTLTDLPNRAYLEVELERLLAVRAPMSLLFLDLDRFKVVNDSLGHRRGDQLLIRAADRLRQCLRTDDLLVRWAGDEFCVVVADETSDAEDLAIADRLLRAVAQPFTIDGREIHLSASVGVARARPGDTAERLLQMADTAMYQAKRAGRSRLSIFDRDDSDDAANVLDYEIELRRAVDDELLTLEYQPVVEVTTGRIVAVESLLRWRFADGSSRPPDEFIAVAEECGLIRDITRWVLRRACAQLAEWDVLTGGSTRDVRAWVNVSGLDLQDAGLVPDVIAALRAASLTPDRLVLEVTESMLLLDLEQVDRTVDGLRGLGVALAIDDFGTGYSSMSRLHQLRVEACKIDRSFVGKAPASEQDAAVLRSLTDLGGVFGFDVVGEGVETVDQLEVLQAVGCRFAQGYLFARPCPPGELLERLVAGRLDVPGGRPGEVRDGGALPSAG